MDPLARNIRRLSGLCLIGFTVAAAATFYWGFLRAPDLAARPDNLRRVAYDQRLRRGRILDRRGLVLAETVFDEDGLPTRKYPYPDAAPVTGYQTWRYGAGSSDRATYGSGGAEAAYDAALRGDIGLSPRELLSAQVLHRPQQGRDVELTLDARLQTYAAQQLGESEGAVVVVDAASGAVRALVSRPTFDPVELDSPQPGSDGAPALLNRATQGLYPPGSTWKTVTLAAALQEGLVTPDTVVADGGVKESFGGFLIGCDNNPESVLTFDIAHAFGWSCNVTFARLGVELGEARYRTYAERFGLGEAPPFPLPTAAGSLTDSDDMSEPELASAAFGQGEVLVTPLNMALVAAAVASGGNLPVPHLLNDIPGVRHRSIADDRGTWRRAVTRATADQMRRIMVISARDGWARSAATGRGITLGGKTGTAQLAEGEPHAWFIGFAPGTEPTIAVAVIVVNGGEGSAVAAPIGGRVLERALELEEES